MDKREFLKASGVLAAGAALKQIANGQQQITPQQAIAQHQAEMQKFPSDANGNIVERFGKRLQAKLGRR